MWWPWMMGSMLLMMGGWVVVTVLTVVGGVTVAIWLLRKK